jgi:CheY-like chemotaxis protein
MREELRDIASGFRGDRILVAEDDPINQRVIQLMLQRAGYSVDVVWNGWQAVAAFHAQRYDLVLMDCRIRRWTDWKRRGTSASWKSIGLPLLL